MTRLRAGSMFVGLGKLLWAKKVPVAQYVRCRPRPLDISGPRACERLETHTWRVHFVTNSTCLFRYSAVGLNRVSRIFLGTLIGTCRTENRHDTAGLAEFQTREFFASGRQAGRANTDWPSILFFTAIVSGSRNMSAQRPRIRSQHARKCDFFRAPPPFHSLRKPFCIAYAGSDLQHF